MAEDKQEENTSWLVLSSGRPHAGDDQETEMSLVKVQERSGLCPTNKNVNTV